MKKCNSTVAAFLGYYIKANPGTYFLLFNYALAYLIALKPLTTQTCHFPLLLISLLLQTVSLHRWKQYCECFLKLLQLIHELFSLPSAGINSSFYTSQHLCSQIVCVHLLSVLILFHTQPFISQLFFIKAWLTMI